MCELTEKAGEIRCPIHGSIGLNALEREILDHPLVQRLRHVSQLGLGSLVFPGATHSRLAHSLGVMHLAEDIFQQAWQTGCRADPDLSKLFNKEYLLKVVRLAGLLHDLGHPPFSHTCEKILLNPPGKTSSRFNTPQEVSHETYSVEMIKRIGQDIPSDLPEELTQDVCSLISASVEPSDRLWNKTDTRHCIHHFLKQVIAGEIDADRMDYLHRDAHFTGTSYGWFDRERLIKGLSCCWQRDHGWVMSLERDTLNAYEDFLMSRIHMTIQVYHHKTVLCFNECLKYSLREGEIRFPISADTFLQAREDSLWDLLHRATEEYEQKRRDGKNHPLSWAERVVRRKPLKLLLYQRIDSQEKNKPLWVKVALKTLERFDVYLVISSAKLSSQGQPGEPPVLVHRQWLGENKYTPLREVSSLLKQYNSDFSFWGLFYRPKDLQNEDFGILSEIYEKLRRIPELKKADDILSGTKRPGK